MRNVKINQYDELGYNVHDDGTCYCIKARRDCNGNVTTTWEHKITSAPKIKRLQKLAAMESDDSKGMAPDPSHVTKFG